jgi:CyaY protein
LAIAWGSLSSGSCVRHTNAMDEPRFRLLADAAFRRILDAYDAIDADEADVETSGNTLNITFGNGERCVANTQAATRQIWLAGGQSGWHFSYDEASGRWLHDKGSGDELFAVLARLTERAIGRAPSFPAL